MVTFLQLCCKTVVIFFTHIAHLIGKSKWWHPHPAKALAAVGEHHSAHSERREDEFQEQYNQY